MTVNSPSCLLKYDYLPFRLGCFPAISQQAMRNVFSVFKGVEAYEDDLSIYGLDNDAHDQRLHGFCIV